MTWFTVPSAWRRVAAVCGVLLAAVPAAPLAAQARVAVVLDRDTPRLRPLTDAFLQEIRGFFRAGEITLLPTAAGDGTAAGVRMVLDRTLADSNVAIVVAAGPIGSSLLATRDGPPKRAIAASIVDAAWQGLPQSDTSGIRNLAWVDQSYSINTTITEFHRLVPFRHMAILVDAGLMQALPGLEAGAGALVREAGAAAAVIPVAGSAEATLRAIPASVDAIYLSPLLTMSEAEVKALLDGLAARRLPVLSYLVSPDVTAGALASYEAPDDWQRRGRRVAVLLQRLLAGEDARRLPVRLVSAPRLTLNLSTARRIGFSPGRSILTDADLVGVDSAGPADTLSLAQVMRAASAANLDLAAADLEVASGRQNVRLARANLLPQVESQIGGTVTREETAAASFGLQPQRKLDGGITATVPLFSDKAWTGYNAEQQLQLGREAERNQRRLDVVLDAATAYLNVLRARTLADARRVNLSRARNNLEIARLREGVGSASRADVYRWQGEVANARRDLIAAESQIRVAALALNRQINRPLDQVLGQAPVSLGDPSLLWLDEATLAWFDEPANFAALTTVMLSEAERLSPELARSDAAIAATERKLGAAGRAYWLPTLALQGGLTNVFDRGGAGSTPPTIPGLGGTSSPDLSWQFRVQASLPLFTGFSRSATKQQAALDLQRLRVERENVRMAVDQRVRSAMETAAASYAGIALARDAADAASRNYGLVSDAYARGAASITTLLDAQSSALTSAEAAANAVHDFLIDLMRVERAMGVFGTLQSPEQRQAFRDRLRTLEVAR